MKNILIVGAGPTGLVLSLALLQRNIAVRIIDEKDKPSEHSKALAIHPRTLEILAKLKVADLFVERGRKAYSLTFHREEHEQKFKIDHLEDTPYPYILILPQSETEKILIEAFEKMGGNIEWNSKLVGLDGNNAILSNQEKIPFDWIIACDGGRSSIRQYLDFSFKGYELEETFLIVDVEGPSKAKDASPHLFFSKKGLVGVIAFKSCLSRLILPMPKNKKVSENIHSIKEELDQRGCRNFISPEQVRWFSYFKIHRRMVNKFRIGNCFLVGDAAHIHSPAGGQGMNICIQDAFNLAWKLSLVLNNVAKTQLLDSYEAERFPIARKVLKHTTHATQLLDFIQSTGYFSLIFFILFFVKNFFKRKISRGLTELSYVYKKSLFIQEPWRDIFWRGPKCGARAPNVKLENGKDLFDYFQYQNPFLLLFEDNDTLKELQCEILVIKDEKLKKAYKAKANSVFFIRPDGVIGYRSRNLKKAEIKSYLSNIFLT